MSTRALIGSSSERSSDDFTTSSSLDYLLLDPDRTVTQLKPRLGFTSGSQIFVDLSTQPSAGYGLFSNTSFVSGDAISLYDGIVIHKLETVTAASLQASSMTHACSIKGSEYVILGFRYVLKGRGLGSFANHAPNNNAVLRKKRLKVRYHNHRNCPFLDSCMVVEACDDIGPGDEIFVKYSRNTLARLGIT